MIQAMCFMQVTRLGAFGRGAPASASFALGHEPPSLRVR